MTFLVRVGQFGQVGRFQAENSRALEYGCRVIVQTARGLEAGEYLDAEEVHAKSLGGQSLHDGQFVRAMTTQDELLEQRLNKNKNEAITACQQLLTERNLEAVILDADQTFDGKRLYFYFSGDVSEQVDEITDALGEVYDSEINFAEFAESLTQGCGPSCGTKEGSGCGTSGCGSCSLKSACKSD